MRKLALALVVAATLGSTAANALGLGDVQLQSRLNQPLNANIQLVALRGTSPDTIEVRMANADEFDRAGIERMYALNDIRFSVEGEGDNVFIRLKTKDAIREPFLNFIVEVNWPSGRLLREYTVLLDPPTFTEDAPVVSAPIYSEPSVPSSSGEIVSAPVVSDRDEETVTQTPTPRTESRPSAVLNTMAGANSYGPTRASETLWSIASRVRPENATVHQTLVAIFKANPQAFANNNPNQMLQDQTLNIPSEEEILKTPQRRALSEFVNQTGAVLETRKTRQIETQTPDSGHLVVSTPKQTTNTRDTNNTTSSREAAEVLNQENANLRNQLEKQQKKATQLEKLVKLKDEQLATVKGDETTPDSTATGTPTDTASTDAAPTDTSTVDSTQETTAEPVAETKPEPVAPKPKVHVPQQVEEPSLVDSLMDNLFYILGGIGVVGLMIGGMILHRRRVGNEKFQDTLLSPEPMTDTPLQFNDDLDLPEVGEDILATQSPDDDSIAGGDVVADPLGEADIYIAYGKFEQAEQLLTRALQDTPNRHELRLKLLECYAEMHDAEKFRAQVNMFQDVIDSDSSIAAQVDQLQQRAWPKDDIVGGSLPTADDIFGSVGVGNNAAVAANKTMETKTGEWAPTSAWEAPKAEASSWTPPAAAEPPMPAVAASDDFNLDANDDFGGFKNTKEEAVLDTPSDDFNFDLDAAEPAQPAWQQAAPERLGSGSDAGEMMLDMDDDSSLPSGDELGMGEIDEIATKLDLARAYIEMHEIDGAREILQEVVSEGNAPQRKEAETLLSRL